MTRLRALGTAAAVAAGAFALVALLRREDRKPLRMPRQPRARRQLDNIVLGAGSLLVAGAVQNYALAPLLARDAGRFGAVRFLAPCLRPLAGFLTLDWAMYWWHRWTHVHEPLWRFHRVHHVDLDLDMSTAIRFHAVDQAISAPMRMAMIVVLGPDARTHDVWNRFFFLSVLFHHANIRLPCRWERRLALFLTTPRMHGIHHMARPEATDSNWSSGISLWDRLHGSFRLDMRADAVRMGVAAYAHRLNVRQSLYLPMADTRGDWDVGDSALRSSASVSAR